MQLITDDTWPQLSQSAKDSGKCHVAVAFVGTGAFEQLPLAPGSILVVNASESSVKTGATNPSELIRYIDAGVKVFSSGKLHAKIYIFGKEVWVGSANVSNNSRSNLIECMAVSSDKSVVRQAKKYVASLAIEPIKQHYARYLTTIYKPPVNNRRSPENALWIQKLFDYEYTPHEQEVHEKNASRLQSELEADECFVDSMRYKPRDTFAKQSVIGDTLIRFQGKWVYEPVKVIGKASSYADDSVLIFVEDREGARRMRLSTFESKLVTIGINLKSRKYPRRADVEKILHLWRA